MVTKKTFYKKNSPKRVIHKINNNCIPFQYSILDFGCGDCERWNHWLRKYGGKNAIGIDIDLKCIKKAKKNIKNGTEFLICDGQKLPFKDCCFQHIHLDGVLHHSPNVQNVLKEIKRTLDGTVQIGEAIDNYFFFRFSRRIIKRWKGKEITQFFDSYKITHEIGKQFKIIKIEHQFSSLANNIFTYLGISENKYYNRYFPFFYKVDYALNALLKKLGAITHFCTHIQISGSNKC